MTRRWGWRFCKVDGSPRATARQQVRGLWDDTEISYQIVQAIESHSKNASGVRVWYAKGQMILQSDGDPFTFVSTEVNP